jgi:membrane protein YdbS with pleckstrin-like domain
MDFSPTYEKGSPMAEETIVHEEKLSFKVALISQGLFSLLTLFVCGLGILVALLRSFSNRYKITNQRVVWTHGLVSQADEEIEFIRVKDTNFRQGILDRIFKVGTVTIVSNDSTSPVVTLYLRNPRKWREKIRDLVRKEKERAGVQVREEI